MIFRYPFELAPAAMRAAAEAFQVRFGIAFKTLTHLSANTLSAMHVRGDDESSLMRNVYVASEHDPDVLGQIGVLTRIANLDAPSFSDRAEYFAALQAVYRRLEKRVPTEDGRLLVAPEREGRILAEALGWLRSPHDLAPHAKRIPYEHGLLVGISDCAISERPRHLVCVDGAIASGATMLALLELLAKPGVPVEIYSVHAAQEGLRAILRFAAERGLSIRIHVGHVTEGLCEKFYAVEAGGRRLVVGDLGDMIDRVAVRAER